MVKNTSSLLRNLLETNLSNNVEFQALDKNSSDERDDSHTEVELEEDLDSGTRRITRHDYVLEKFKEKRHPTPEHLAKMSVELRLSENKLAYIFKVLRKVVVIQGWYSRLLSKWLRQSQKNPETMTAQTASKLFGSILKSENITELHTLIDSDAPIKQRLSEIQKIIRKQISQTNKAPGTKCLNKYVRVPIAKG